MVANFSQLAQSLKSSKQVLILLNSNLPLPLTLWNTLLVAILTRLGKVVTVLVADEPQGWGKLVDQVYPTDMVLSLEQLRQIITIPFSGDRQSISNVAYEIAENNLNVTIIPNEGSLQMDNLQIQEHGHHYDVVLGVGVSSTHPLIEQLTIYATSLSDSVGYFVGTFAQEGVLKMKLPYLKAVSTIETGSDLELFESAINLSAGGTRLTPEIELLTLLGQQIMKMHEWDMKVQASILGQLQIAGDTAAQGEKILQVYTGDFAKQNRILHQLLSTAQYAGESQTELYAMNATQFRALSYSITEIIASSFFLPRFTIGAQRIICISETEQKHHVLFEGDPENTRKLAQRFGFALTNSQTCGIVEGVSVEKLIEDLQRITSGHNTFEPTTSVIPTLQYAASPTVDNADSVQLREGMTTGDYQKDSIPELSQHEYSEEELDSGEIIDSGKAESLPVEQYSAELPPETSAESLAAEIPTSPGIDFAAIAKKMRESIT